VKYLILFREHLRNHTKKVKFNPLDYPKGYPEMAARLSIDSDHDTALVRHIGNLHARYPTELAELEAQLDKRDQEDEGKSGADASSLRKNQTISRPRYRRGRGPRQEIGLNGSDDPNDPVFYLPLLFPTNSNNNTNLGLFQSRYRNSVTGRLRSARPLPTRFPMPDTLPHVRALGHRKRQTI
jgi:hypothetical protein